MDEGKEKKELATEGEGAIIWTGKGRHAGRRCTKRSTRDAKCLTGEVAASQDQDQ
jgi:hypothetical protein